MRLALRLGLVNTLTPKGVALEKALGLARSIADNAPLAIAAVFQAFQAARPNNSEAWAAGEAHWPGLVASDDAREGPKAFKEKRTLVWTGK